MYTAANLRTALIRWHTVKYNAKVIGHISKRGKIRPLEIFGSQGKNDPCYCSLSYWAIQDTRIPSTPSRQRLPVVGISDQYQPRRHVMSSSTPLGSQANERESKKRENISYVSLPDPEFDWEYLLNPDNREAISSNIQNRKGVGDINKVVMLWSKLNYPEEVEVNDFLQDRRTDVKLLKKELVDEAISLPNTTHPDVPIGDDSQNRLVQTVGNKREFTFQPKTVTKLAEDLDMLRIENVGHTTGPRSYYLMGELAHLEQALVRYTIDNLEHHGFLLTSVPDLVHPDIVERCGFKTTGERSQVYKLDPSKHEAVCLAGTGEMPLAGFYMGKKFDSVDLPIKVMTVSRCFRAETSDLEEEKGIYRVHQFTKVEMFGMTPQDTGQESEQLREEFVEIQKILFSQLGLHFRVLEMASQELGAPAYRKYDMEAWMPARSFWGEISSTSNCLDFQSRRLCIKYGADPQQYKHVHTVNGTACAIPRMIMAILENNQRKDGTVEIPEALHSYMNGETLLQRSPNTPEMKWMKFTKLYKSKLTKS